jgi:hypothetical protein
METQLSRNETELAELLATVMQAISDVQTKAADVRAEGGDCKAAFMSVVPEDNRPMMEMQWPMVSMLLGV